MGINRRQYLTLVAMAGAGATTAARGSAATTSEDDAIGPMGYNTGYYNGGGYPGSTVEL